MGDGQGRLSWQPSRALREALDAARPVGDGRRISVLLADDDAPVRSLIARVLLMAGWDVVAVENGQEALRAWPPNGQPFDLVILDLMMPEMNGVDTYRELRHAHPHARFLITSAYYESLDEVAGLARGQRTAFVPKPFLPVALLNRARALLEDAADHDDPVQQSLLLETQRN